MKRLALVALLLAGCPHPPPGTCSTQGQVDLDACAQHLASGDLERAKISCELAERYCPTDADVYVNEGDIALRELRYPDANALYVKALHLNPDHTGAHNDLGVVLEHDGEPARARDEYQRALDANPRFFDARENLGAVLIKLGDLDGARKAFLTLAETQPQSAVAQHALCRLDVEAQDFERAAAECAEAVRLDPRFTDAYQSYGAVLLVEGRFCAARDVLAECLRLEPGRAECRDAVAAANEKCAQSPK